MFSIAYVLRILIYRVYLSHGAQFCRCFRRLLQWLIRSALPNSRKLPAVSDMVARQSVLKPELTRANSLPPLPLHSKRKLTKPAPGTGANRQSARRTISLRQSAAMSSAFSAIVAIVQTMPITLCRLKLSAS